MRSSYLLHHLILFSAQEQPDRVALRSGDVSLDYRSLASLVQQFASGLVRNKLEAQERVAIFLEKRPEFVVACFGSSCAGLIFVPINPILKADQVLHIVNDAEAKVLVTSAERLEYLRPSLRNNKSLELIILVDHKSTDGLQCRTLDWAEFMADHPEYSSRHMVDTDAVSLFYTSGSTGRPKGVVLSHRNMVMGAKSVASYLENCVDDVLLAALPLSFDAGFSQLTTAFYSGSKVVLLNYILPNDILGAVVRERVTGLTAVPPLWIQVANLKWPQSVNEHLRYFANTGGRMPLEVLRKLRQNFPSAKPFLMYGLTEAFRSTYLPPEEIDKRPDSIGKAIPNAEILVLNKDGNPCGPRQPGELVHRGALVGLGYWRDPEKTAERYKVLPTSCKARPDGITVPELAVFSGDIVEMDEDGFLYFIGRDDEMIKTSGYRVSPTELEEVIYSSGLVEEAAAFGVADDVLGQVIVISIFTTAEWRSKSEQVRAQILSHCKDKLPLYMVPKEVIISAGPHARNPNGKLDRKRIAKDYEQARSGVGQ